MINNHSVTMSVSGQFIRSTECYKSNIIIDAHINNETSVIEKVLDMLGANISEGYSTFEVLLRDPEDFTKAYIDTVYCAYSKSNLKYVKLFLDAPILMAQSLEVGTIKYSISDINDFYKKYEPCESITLKLNQSLDKDGEVLPIKSRRKVRLPKYSDDFLEF